jgi:hypothetical protein
MPNDFLEAKLKEEYGQDSKIPYKVLNAKGYWHGNRQTERGREANRKHERKLALKKRSSK